MSLSLELVTRNARNAVDALRRRVPGSDVMAEQYFNHDHPAMVNEIHYLRRALQAAQDEIMRLTPRIDVKA